MPPVHPGEILLEEFLTPLGVSQYQLAKAVDVPARRINEIVHGQRRITADTALRLARFFGTSERFWLNLQARYDLEVEKDRLGPHWTRSGQCTQPADDIAVADREPLDAVQPAGAQPLGVPGLGDGRHGVSDGVEHQLDFQPGETGAQAV